MMRRFFLCSLLPLLILGSWVSAEEQSVDSTEESPSLDEALIQQVLQLNEEKQELQQEQMTALREKYPDLFPARQTYPSLKFYNQTFDSGLANTIFFAPGSSYLSDVQVLKLAAIAEAMQEAPETSLIIEGHSANNYQIEDGKERLFYNRWISGRRAVQVWRYLIREHGIDSTRLAMYAYDAQRTLNDEKTESLRALNRRVELRLTNQPIGFTSTRQQSRAASPGTNPQ